MSLYAAVSKLLTKMRRAGFAVLLTVALAWVGDREGTTGGTREGAGQVDRDLQLSREISQFSSSRASRSEAPSKISSGEASPPGALVRTPRGAAAREDAGRHASSRTASTAAASGTELPSAPRAARHPGSPQQRSGVNRRQSTRAGSAGARRLAG